MSEQGDGEEKRPDKIHIHCLGHGSGWSERERPEMRENGTSQTNRNREKHNKIREEWIPLRQQMGKLCFFHDRAADGRIHRAKIREAIFGKIDAFFSMYNFPLVRNNFLYDHALNKMHFGSIHLVLYLIFVLNFHFFGSNRKKAYFWEPVFRKFGPRTSQRSYCDHIFFAVRTMFDVSPLSPN